MRKLQICFFIASLRQGGAERVVAGLCESMAARGHDVCIITLHKKTSEDYLLPKNVKRIDLDLIRESQSQFDAIHSNWKRLKLLRRHLKEEAPDVIVSFLTTSNVLTLFATISLKIPVIVSERIYPLYSPGTRLWLLLRPLAYRLAAIVVVQSAEGKKWLEDNTQAEEVVVIPNSIPWPPSRYDPEVRPDMFVKQGQNLILAIGRITPQKGFFDLIEAFSQAIEDDTQWDLAIIGEGEVVILESEIQLLGLVDRIHIVGGVGNVEDWYDRADVFCLSSHYEGFPNALVESMAAGCAVMSYDCLTGPGDMIDHGKNGLLAEVGNVDELAKGLKMLMNDSDLRSRLGTEAKNVKLKYSPELVDLEWEKLMQQVIK